MKVTSSSETCKTISEVVLNNSSFYEISATLLISATPYSFEI